MASDTSHADTFSPTGDDDWPAGSYADFTRRLLEPLASLKLTVALFAMSIVIVLAGTLAQHRKDVWQVVDQYFRTGIAYIEFADLTPPSFFGPRKTEPGGGFPFPGGWLIGGMMALNLLAAHGVRFKVQARGGRLAAGLAIIGVGCLTTWVVIASGSNSEGFQSAPLISYDVLWDLLKVAVGSTFLFLSFVYVQALRSGTLPGWAIRLGASVLASIGVVFGLMLTKWADARLDDAGMRILWQVVKALFAAFILLAGCILAFKKRCGIVLLHAGVLLMMFSELQVGLTAVESQMRIDEGQAMNYSQDHRTFELAVVDTNPNEVHGTQYLPRSWRQSKDALAEKVNNTVAVPKRMLTAEGEWISHDALPFDVEIVDYMQNSDLLDVGGKQAAGLENPADAGAGLKHVARELKPETGTDSRIDVPALYVRLLNKRGGKPLGTWLLTPYLLEQSVKVGETTYQVALRFKRHYKPYVVTLKDVRKRDYLGTATPRDYSSFVVLRDEERDVERDIRVWMNNPLRYAGETFYQSEYSQRPVTFTDPATGAERPVLVTDPETGSRRPKTIESTVLAVVTNDGWMIPYVACMIVGTGMLAQFTIVLNRFLRRRKSEEAMILSVVPETGPRGLQRAPTVEAIRQSSGRRRKGRGGRSDRPAEPEHFAAEPDSDVTVWRQIGRVCGWLLPAAVVGCGAAFIYGRSQAPQPDTREFQIYEFGKLPIIYNGRTKPIDTLARNSLLAISGKETLTGTMPRRKLLERWPDIRAKLLAKWDGLSEDDLKPFADDPSQIATLVETITDKTGEDRYEVTAIVESLTSERQPAIRWLLDLIARREAAMDHKVFRIEHPDVLATLGLERRKGYRYAVSEFQRRISELTRQAVRARGRSKDDLDTYDRKILELEKKIGVVYVLMQTFAVPRIRPDHVVEDFHATVGAQEEFQEQHPPLVVPSAEPSLEWTRYLALLRSQREMGAAARPVDEHQEWTTYSAAWSRAWFDTNVTNEKPPKSFEAMTRLIDAWGEESPADFNTALDDYRTALKADPPENLELEQTDFEAYFNQFAPFHWSGWLYLAAFVLAALAWLGWSEPLNRASFWLIVLTLGLHTYALIARIYISGRPPVTNLYSSAVFIGWGTVVLGLVVESVYRLGLGNVLASVSGYSTLLIASKLAEIAWKSTPDGDTFTVLQAVLDTQFWLATHVTCITMGYATTFVAGLLGLIYVIRGFATPALTKTEGHDLARMIYGALCFAILFSFVGTVLGGLWADDSWGRFWGWDPKENGALIIVIWNALVLHARWGGLVKERGLAVLAIGGNIVTSWSWFGVNELGIGLHSYGFTEGVLKALLLFAISQAIVITLGCLPKNAWWSFRAQDRTRQDA